MTWEYEEKAWANGYGSVCGVDEAGRGPVAGPVCAAAVILPAGIVIEGLNDSKKLSEKKREKLFDEITENALAWSVSLVDERVIDEINILQATYRAMKQAVDGLTRPADFVYVDGNRSQGLEQPHECVVSGDAKIPSVAAASIIAKVTRDRLMRRFAEQFFAKSLHLYREDERAAILDDLEQACEDDLWDDGAGCWVADYRLLRFTARKVRSVRGAGGMAQLSVLGS